MRSKLGAGILAGILAALPYGLIMSIATAPMGEPMILMVAHIVRSDSLAVAWILLLLGGAVMGAFFGVLFGSRAAGLRAWLVRGPSTARPGGSSGASS
ncbi:MAG TPA: hypothetical protein VFH11_05415 [Gemmatimonadota bacterium]|nr:hypothetical protein [Gemmatimonadota bacterium]